ncbi:MAG TPA: DUF2752 domain-containing protein [bacterium]|nr:DUF2752 domain-containing protein [bacterium]
MKISIRSTKSSDLEVGLLLLLFGLLGMAVSHFLPGVVERLPRCLFREWTTLPCPSCGATHAGIALSHARLWSALRINPLFTLFYLGMVLAAANALAGLLFGRNLALSWTLSGRRRLLFTLLIALLLNWAYLIALRFGAA